MTESLLGLTALVLLVALLLGRRIIRRDRPPDHLVAQGGFDSSVVAQVTAVGEPSVMGELRRRVACGGRRLLTLASVQLERAPSSWAWLEVESVALELLSSVDVDTPEQSGEPSPLAAKGS